MKPGASHSAAGASEPSLALPSGVIGGSTGGASEAELRRGWKDCGDDEGYRKGESMGLASTYDPFALPDQHNGFLDRPEGWER